MTASGDDCMMPGMRLPSALNWLIDEASTVPGSDHFLTALGAQLISDGLPLAGGTLKLAAPHPIIARRAWLWRAERGGYRGVWVRVPGLSQARARQCRPRLADRARHRVGPRVCRRPGSRQFDVRWLKVGQPCAGLCCLAVPHRSGIVAVARGSAVRCCASRRAGRAVDAGGAARGLSRPTQRGAGAGRALAARDRRDHPGGSALWRFARLYRASETMEPEAVVGALGAWFDRIAGGCFPCGRELNCCPP